MVRGLTGKAEDESGTGGAGEEDNAARQDSVTSAVGHDLLAGSLRRSGRAKALGPGIVGFPALSFRMSAGSSLSVMVIVPLLSDASALSGS